MPWRGAREPGEFPTLGFDVGKWMEGNLVIGDGWRQGETYRLTREMWKFLVWFYRLWPDAQPWPSSRGLYYTGGQLRRSQKWGKDPFGAAVVWAEALGPSRFSHWDEHGEPVGRPYPTPLIVELGTSEDQTANTWRPTLAMARLGALNGDRRVNALDDSKIDLSSGGKIEPATTSAKARLGAPMSFVTITESHLFTLQGGYRKVAGAVKRNVAGMDGRWLELTNAWDPTEASEAQVTAKSGDRSVYVDTVEPKRVEVLEDGPELRRELARQYGDSARERGGWVNLDRIVEEVTSSRHMEADKRRFFLNEIVVGESVLVVPEQWDAKYRPGELSPTEQAALGFDGSKYRDATALVASRLSDGRLFELAVWERPKNAGADWRVPSADVDRAVQAVFEAYAIAVMFADPYRWQDYLDAWSALYPGRVVEFPTNQEQRMDGAIERFITSFGAGEITHNSAKGADEEGVEPHPLTGRVPLSGGRLGTHMKGAVVVKGGRKKARPGETDEDGDETLSTNYLKLAKRGPTYLIDLAVAGVLAHAARAHAIEHKLEQRETEVWGFWE